MTERTLRAFWLGRRKYAPAAELMARLVEHARRGLVETDGGQVSQSVDDVVLLLEHEPVITLGRGADAENILLSGDALASLGVDLADTGRGGDVTVHGPGQLVAYPIVSLLPGERDVRKYVARLTRVMAALARQSGVDGGTVEGKIGLWIDAESPARWPGEEAAKTPVKLGAIGVRISRWLTSHGFALNLSTDLRLFSYIVPCGIREYGVATLESYGSEVPSVRAAAERAAPLLAQELGRTLEGVVDLSDEGDDALFTRIHG